MRLFVLSIVLLISTYTIGQVENMKVQASGVHEDREKAKNLALREALEMTIGVYISSSTSIQNNKLINDEVISLSRGLIKSYKVISELQNNDNEWMVVVKAVVSLDNTLSYIQKVSPQGTSVKLNVNTYAINKINRDFAKDNEPKIISETLGEMHNLFEKGFDYKIIVSEPVGDNLINIGCKISVYANNNITIAAKHFTDVLDEVSLDLSEINLYKEKRIPFHTITLRHKNKLHVYFLRNSESVDIIRRIFNNFSYYLSRAEIYDGLKSYPLKNGYLSDGKSRKTIIEKNPFKSHKTSIADGFLHISRNSNEMIDKFFSPYGKKYDLIPLSVYNHIVDAIEPSEWTGRRRINNKEKSEIFSLYKKSDIENKSIEKIVKLINKINKKPYILDSAYDVIRFCEKNNIIIKNKSYNSEYMLLGPRGIRLERKYLTDEFFRDGPYPGRPSTTTILSLFQEGKLINTVYRNLEYPVDQLKKISKISIRPLNALSKYKNKGIQIHRKNGEPIIFKLRMGHYKYSNLKKNNLNKDGWIRSDSLNKEEAKYIREILEYLKDNYQFNLYPQKFYSNGTSVVKKNLKDRKYNRLWIKDLYGKE